MGTAFASVAALIRQRPCIDKDFDRIGTECPRYDQQFDHINPALTALILRNKALRFPSLAGGSSCVTPARRRAAAKHEPKIL